MDFIFALIRVNKNIIVSFICEFMKNAVFLTNMKIVLRFGKND